MSVMAGTFANVSTELVISIVAALVFCATGTAVAFRSGPRR
jgi:hypothetical protein